MKIKNCSGALAIASVPFLLAALFIAFATKFPQSQRTSSATLLSSPGAIPTNLSLTNNTGLHELTIVVERAIWDRIIQTCLFLITDEVNRANKLANGPFCTDAPYLEIESSVRAVEGRTYTLIVALAGFSEGDVPIGEVVMVTLVDVYFSRRQRRLQFASLALLGVGIISIFSALLLIMVGKLLKCSMNSDILSGYWSGLRARLANVVSLREASKIEIELE